MDSVEKLIKKYDIPVVRINENRNYWLVRTQSGEYHEKFGNPSNEEYFKKEISNKYPDSKQPGLIYNQIKRFFTEIKIDDLVMIPTKNSTHISFGKITSKPYIADLSETDIEEGSCPFQKRMDVEWIKTVKRSDLDSYLYKMMHSHHTINNANDYTSSIDRTLHSFYIKNNAAHLVININKQEAIMDLYHVHQRIFAG